MENIGLLVTAISIELDPLGFYSLFTSYFYTIYKLILHHLQVYFITIEITYESKILFVKPFTIYFSDSAVWGQVPMAKLQTGGSRQPLDGFK